MEARNMGMSGVPYFVLNNKYAVSGAQPIEAFVGALTQAYNEMKPLKNIGNDDGSCSADGCNL